MNTYPALGQLVDTQRERLVDHQRFVGLSNRLYTRVLQGQKGRWRFVVQHLLTGAQRSTLRSFYSANQYDPFFFSLTDPNDTQTHECVFIAPPDEQKQGPGYWLVTVQLETWKALTQPAAFILMESGDFLLQENGDKIGLE